MIYSEYPYREVQQIWPRLRNVMNCSDIIYPVSSFSWYWVITVLHTLSLQWESPCLKELCAVKSRRGRTEMSWLKTTERVIGRARGFLVPYAGLFSSALHQLSSWSVVLWRTLVLEVHLLSISIKARYWHWEKIQSIVKHRSANPL